jgi:hypothetical protein
MRIGRNSFQSWRASLPDRPSGARKLKGGALVPIENTASASNPRSKKITIKHAGKSGALRLAVPRCNLSEK